MEFRVLGRLEVISSDGHVITISRPQVRAAIFVLVFHANRSLTAERLIELMWGEVQQNRSHALRNCMWGVRQVLPPHRLVTDDVGYRLLIDDEDDTVDLVSFRELYGQGRAAERQGDYSTAADLFERALKFWRDPPLTDLLPETIAMEALITGLEQEREGARDALLEARLTLGHHRDLLPELRSLVLRDPMNEHLRALLMLALYRYGLKIDALHVFDEARVILRKEADTDPGVELQRLRRQILDDDPALNRPPTAYPSGPVDAGPAQGTDAAARAPIAQLPPDIMSFTGRSEECAELEALLTPEDVTTGVPMALVIGPPGIGKTCLTVHVAHSVRRRYTGGQLYLQLAGSSPHPRDPGAVLKEILQALGVPAADIPDATDQRSTLFRSRLADQKILVVLDDAASLDQVQPLLPGTAGCAVVITSRVQLPVMADAHPINLEPLTQAEALKMLGHIIGHARLNADRSAAEVVVTACGGFPLAVRIAGARLAARPSWPLARLADQLSDERQRLNQLVAGDLAVRASIALSYQALDGRAQRAFRLMALAGPNDVASWVFAVLLGEQDADDVIEVLVDRGMLAAVAVDALGQPRYRLHDLLRDYASELLADDPDNETARDRLIIAWLELVDRADEHMPREPYFPAPARYAQKTFAIESADRMVTAEPRAWLGVERANVLTMIDTACAAGKYGLAVGLALRLAAYLMLHGHHDDAEKMWRTVTDAAEQTGDAKVAAQARLRCAVVIAHDRGHHGEAIPMADACVTTYEKAGDQQNLAGALALRAYCAQALAQPAAARRDAERGLSLARACRNAHTEFSCLRILGHTMSQLGDHDQAVRHSEEALTVARRLEEDSYEGIALYTVIHVLLQAGRYDRVPGLGRQGLELAARIGLELGTGYYRQQIGVALRELGQHDPAIDELSAAVHAFESQQADRAAASCRLQLADTLRRVGRYNAAIDNLEATLPIFQTLGMAAEEQQARAALTECRAQTEHLGRAVTADDPAATELNTHLPHSARMYDYCLGGKDNFAADREAVLGFVSQFPEGLDVTRENRLFLYRVVRYLARDAGIRQYLDMGSGLPTQANVHQVAQEFQPDSHVVYIDNDPIVMVHGRALLAEESTTVIQADMTDPQAILARPDVRRLIDFDRPTAVLFLSVAHSIPDDAQIHDMFAGVVRALAPGSFLALSQFVGVNKEAADAHTKKANEMGLVWKTRTIDQARELAPDLEPVPPGLVDIADWRPDPHQPPLSPVDAPLQPFVGAAASNKQVKEFGGVLRIA